MSAVIVNILQYVSPFLECNIHQVVNFGGLPFFVIDLVLYEISKFFGVLLN